MTKVAKRVLLAGATGYIGRAVAGELVSRGWDVLALVRKPCVEVRKCTVLVVELTDASKLASVLADERVDAIVSCVASRSGVAEDAWLVDYQVNRNLLALAEGLGASHFQLLSAICVQRPRLAFQQAKLAFESELQQAGVDYTIVRPTAYFKSLSGQVRRVLDGKPFMVFGNGTKTACKPISEPDLARFMVDCLDDPAASNRVLPIGGPGEPVTLRQAGELLFELAEKQPRFRHVPVVIFSIAIGLLSALGKLIPAAAKKAELARIGRYYATESMLVWDEEHCRYDAEATPSTGTDTLREHYARILRDGIEGHELGDHKLLD